MRADLAQQVLGVGLTPGEPAGTAGENVDEWIDLPYESGGEVRVGCGCDGQIGDVGVGDAADEARGQQVDEAADAALRAAVEAQIEAEKKELENRRDADVETRAQKLEKDIAELEAEGAKSDAKRKVRDSAEREMNQIRKRADQQIERVEQVWDRFKNLKVQDLEGDELLYSEMTYRFGQYFEGYMGAAAIRSAEGSRGEVIARRTRASAPAPWPGSPRSPGRARRPPTENPCPARCFAAIHR